MDPMDMPPTDTHVVAFEALTEVARRLNVWASEVEKPASHILRSLATNLHRCATSLVLIGSELAVSQILAQEEAQRREMLRSVEALPPWIGPLYLEHIAQLAGRAHLLRIVKDLGRVDPNG